MSTLHRTIVYARERLRGTGHRGPTIDAALLLAIELLRLAVEPGGIWRGPTSSVAGACGKSDRAIRRSLRALEAAGLIESRGMGALGIEVTLTGLAGADPLPALPASAASRP